MVDLLSRVRNRVKKGLVVLSTVARDTVEQLRAELPHQKKPAPAPPTPPRQHVVNTSDKGVLVGLVGLKLALTPQERPMLVNHWATWCEGCVTELPLLVQLHDRWKDRVDFVGVGWEGFQGGQSPTQQLAAVERASEEHGLGWSTLIYEGTPESLFGALELKNQHIPQTTVTTVSGETLYTHAGVLDVEAVNTIEALLRECLAR